jgi:thioredoxin-related protein
LTDWSEIRSAQEKKSALLVLLVEQSDCHYCDTIKRDFIGPALTLETYGKKVIYRRLSIDPDLLIRFNGKRVSTRDFVKKFDAVYAPTVLFFGPKQNTLADNLVGISNPDYYGHYFEKSIIDSLEKLKIPR